MFTRNISMTVCATAVWITASATTLAADVSRTTVRHHGVSFVGATDSAPSLSFCLAERTIADLTRTLGPSIIIVADGALHELRSRARPADRSHCTCLTRTASVIVATKPELEADVRRAFSQKYPECAMRTTYASKDHLAKPSDFSGSTRTAAGAPKDRGEMLACGQITDCAFIEPSTLDVSITTQ